MDIRICSMITLSIGSGNNTQVGKIKQKTIKYFANFAYNYTSSGKSFSAVRIVVRKKQS